MEKAEIILLAKLLAWAAVQIVFGIAGVNHYLAIACAYTYVTRARHLRESSFHDVTRLA